MAEMQQIRAQSTLPQLHLEEALHQALRREEALHVPVPDPRGQGHRHQVKSVRSVRVVGSIPDQMLIGR